MKTILALLIIAQYYPPVIPNRNQPEVVHINPTDGERASLAMQAQALEGLGVKSNDRIVYINPSAAQERQLQAEQIYMEATRPNQTNNPYGVYGSVLDDN